MARQKGITRYSKTWPGSESNYNWPVQFDITDGIVGITQTHSEPRIVGEPALERVLLNKRQIEELIRFVKGK